MPRKVLVIAPQPFFAPRGTPMIVRALEQTTASTGAEVHLLVYPFGEDVSISGVILHRSWGLPGVRSVPVGASWRKLFLDFPLCLAALVLAIRMRFDVFHGI